MKNTSDIITAREAAEIIGVDESQVRRYCENEQLPGTKFGTQWAIRRVDAKRFKRRPPGRPPAIATGSGR